MNDFENISSISFEEDYLLNKRYKIEKKIGEGSYGIVYKAKDTKNNNNLVAIKQVSKYRINSSSYLIEALQKELSIMRLLSKKSDEHCVNLLEDFETDEYYNFVMELCDSDLDVELKKHIKINNTGFNELEVYEIMKQFNSIFKIMQNEHIIHRDLKLKNIMIKKINNNKNENENVDIGFIIKLSDFGFSKVMNEDEITGTNLGSPVTKAPEIMDGKEYNAKADLWSVGVIMYQLFYNKLPFPANNARELKIAIFNSNGVVKPQDSNNDMSEICFNLIDNLLQKYPQERIDFDNYFNHNFFSEEHKNELIEKFRKIKKENNNIEKNYTTKNEEKININNNNLNNINLKDNIINENINDYNIEYNMDYEKRYKKILKIKEYDLGYNLYKGKDLSDDKYIYIKEISRSIIDNNARNKRIFEKEIKLLSILKGEKFPEKKDIFKTNDNYYIIIEYFSGNSLYNFINKYKNLDESLVYLILNQLKKSLLKLSEKNIILEFISPKNFAFKYYQNETNFEIKFFDYGLNSIFFEEKYIKYYLLEEAELGYVNDSSINILSIGLIVYKMLFGEEALIKKNGDYEVKIKGKIKSEYPENLKNFLSRCIKKEKRYNWEEFYYDDFLNFNLVGSKSSTNLDKKREPLIKDEKIEKIFEIIINKINYIISYFDKQLDDKENFLDSDIYNNYYEEIITFILFCKLECQTILKFLEFDPNDNSKSSKNDESDKEIHLLKIYLNKKNKDSNKYDYSYINFVNENKNNIIFLYNKENPTFELYNNIFNEIKEKIEIIYNKFIGINNINNSNKVNDLERTNSSTDELTKTLSPNLNNNTHEKTLIDNLDLKDEKDTKLAKEGNLDKLFMKYFENGSLFYSLEERDKAIEDLKISKYIAEYIIFLRIILGNKDNTLNFEKITLDINENNSKETNEKDIAIFATFIGGKIKILKEKGILGNNDGSNDNLNDYNDPKIENIKIYDTMINFYPRIIQFIKEIEKENH